MNNIKKIITLSLSICCFTHTQTDIKFRVAAFIPTSGLFRDIYGTVGPNYQLEISHLFSNCLDLWFNTDFFYKKGCICNCGPSKVFLANVSAGPVYYFELAECFSPYLGAGLALGTASVKNQFFCADKERAVTFGVVIKSGLKIYRSNHYFIDLFFDYFYQPAFFKQKHADIGGCKTGLGVGYEF